MVNTSMDFFKNGVGWCVRHRDPKDPKPVTSVKHPAPIFRKRQAASAKLQATSSQALSDKRQALSSKRQASSRKRQALQSDYPHKVSSS